MSVDRLIVRYWARRRHLPEPEFLRPPPSVSANLALRLLQVHVCIIYAASGLSKLQGPAWWSGVAVWGTMANYEFSPMNLQIYTAFLQFLCKHRWLWELVMTGGSSYPSGHAAYAVAYVAVAIALSRALSARAALVTLAVVLTVAIGLTLGDADKAIRANGHIAQARSQRSLKRSSARRSRIP